MSKEAVLYTTTFPKDKKREDTQYLRFVLDDGAENEAVNLYPQVKFQEWEGFGGAFTDASGFVFSQMEEAQKRQLMEAYYGENGAGYTLGRVHLDSCDFSMGHYEAVSDPEDRDMKTFTLARSEKYILPMIRSAENIYGSRIPMMAAPWSPPAFMKTNRERNHGGHLEEKYRDFYAGYLCRYIMEMRKAGANITRLSIQNEPNATQTWDSCLYSPEDEKTFIRDFLHPALKTNGLDDVELFIWDHNKERVLERALAVIDETTDELIAGIAFHWYSGDHFEALDLVSRKWPEKKLVQSESCIEYSHYSSEDFLSNAQKYAHDIIGDMNGGMTAFYDWNLVLDEKGGPNHVNNYCDAPFLYRSGGKVLEERASYAYLRHFSKFIKQGARRIGFSRYSDQIEVTAFENPDGSLAAVIMNRTPETLPITLRLNGELTNFRLPMQSISTITI